jgi:hypothetical protein
MAAPAAAPVAPAAPVALAAPAAGNGLISHDAAHNISVVLKELPDWATHAKRFCTHFGIGKVREIPAAREQEAIQIAQQIATEVMTPAAPAAPTEINPFD